MVKSWFCFIFPCFSVSVLIFAYQVFLIENWNLYGEIGQNSSVILFYNCIFISLCQVLVWEIKQNYVEAYWEPTNTSLFPSKCHKDKKFNSWLITDWHMLGNLHSSECLTTSSVPKHHLQKHINIIVVNYSCGHQPATTKYCLPYFCWKYCAIILFSIPIIR